MASSSASFALVFALALASATAQELPKASGPTAADLEPKLILTDVPGGPLPEEVPSNGLPAQPPADVAKLQSAVESAKRNAAMRERLAKAGVLSKFEAEQGQMRVVRLTRDLELARFAAAQREVDTLQKTPPTDDAGKKALEDAKAHLTTTETNAKDAAAKWDQALKAAAELRVQRERKLVSLGADPKIALKQAESALQKLVAPVVSSSSP